MSEIDTSGLTQNSILRFPARNFEEEKVDCIMGLVVEGVGLFQF